MLYEATYKSNSLLNVDPTFQGRGGGGGAGEGGVGERYIVVMSRFRVSNHLIYLANLKKVKLGSIFSQSR